MTVDLSSAYMKLARARVHAGAVKAAVDTFLAVEPYQLEHRVQAGGLIHEWRLTKYTSPPTDIGLIVGDAIHNLRSILDHAAFALAVAGASAQGHVLTDDEMRQIQFPTCKEVSDFRSQVGWGWLRCVEPIPHALIERYQPYNIRHDYAHSVPYVLTKLDNVDKHRVIPTLSEVVTDQPARKPVPDTEVFTPLADWGPGVVVLTRTYALPQAEDDVVFEPGFSLAIDGAWPPTESPVESLERYAEWIETTILQQLDSGVDLRTSLGSPVPPIC